MVASLAGHAIAFDHFTSEVLRSPNLYMRYARAATRAAREPLTFGIDSTPPLRERVTELVERCGLALLEQHTLGERATVRARGGFVLAGVLERSS